tara:strand:- start:171 stop:923 length:753 start_codon:yes stop_codon:yes gene_type:complete
MPRYFIHLAYDGGAFCGWQIQPNARSVQGDLEENLTKVLREPIYVTGCGRTDTGVHASDFYAHFDVNHSVDGEQLAYKINKMMGGEVAVFSIFQVEDDLHARFSALDRTYHYFIQTTPNPFKRDFSWYFPYELDLEKMNQAAASLLEFDDFSSFCRSGSDVTNHLCDVRKAIFEPIDGGYRFEISANRFLRNMVRAVVGTLLEVGTGKISVDEFKQIVKQKDRKRAGASAKAHGLFLCKIKYPDSINRYR